MRELAHVDIEQTIPLGNVRAALNVRDNRTVKSILARHGIPLLALSRGSHALRRSDYDLLLNRASQVQK